jgi:hypothetical protein
MKKYVGIMVVALVLVVSQAWALIVPTMYGQNDKGNRLVIKLVCTAEADGTFADTQITAAHIGWNYWQAGYFLLDAWAVNSATNDHTNAAVVTITDETTHQIIGATAGDTLTLSQSASGVAYASMSRSAGQRAVTSKLTIGIADTGSTSTVQTIYLVLGR